MANNVDAISGLNHVPYTVAQTQERVQRSEKALQTGNIKSEALGPKECKT